VDVLTIEIEQVNVEALEQLEREGVRIIPTPPVLRMIQNKILQKEFYRSNNLPTAPFRITQSRSQLAEHLDFLPAVHKLGMGGYDGRGGSILLEANDLPKGFDAPAVLEKKIDIDKEIAVLVAVGVDGNCQVYPSVEMVFDPRLNLLDYQVCPATISSKIEMEASALAKRLVQALGSPGIFAVEMFIGRDGQLSINEIAPRVHNSGHHTIEAHYSSQFDMLWRILLDLPLGNPAPILPSVMINLIGADGETGPAKYQGREDILQLPNVFLHVYGKRMTKPGRKMGHITLIGPDREQLVRTAETVKSMIRVVSVK